jgi:disulfide bond formation protein DsbB
MNTTENLLLINWITATGTLFLEIAIFLFILILIYFYFTSEKNKSIIRNFFENKIKISEKVLNLIGLKFTLTIEKISIWKIFVFSLFASVMTLVYSEIFGVVPCALCWFERVFMYGIVLISGIALFSRNDLERRGIFRYLIVFSILGAVVSLYHHVLQMTATASSHLPCPVSGGDCGKMIVFEYGHITFTFMAFVLFSLFIVITVFVKTIRK